jgi:hypothetical protein
MAAAYLIVKEAGAKIYSYNGLELESELGVDRTMSFMAVIDDLYFLFLHLVSQDKIRFTLDKYKNFSL